MLSKREGPQPWERVGYVQHGRILEDELHLPNMPRHGTSRSTPKRIQRASDGDALKGIAGRVTTPESSPSDVEMSHYSLGT